MDWRTFYDGVDFGRVYFNSWVYSEFTVCKLFDRSIIFVLFGLSYKNKYKCYKAEPNLKITKYFWIELSVHILFIIAAVVQSALNVRISISGTGLNYKHEFFFISIMILLLHIVYMCVDYYVTEKAAII